MDNTIKLPKIYTSSFKNKLLAISEKGKEEVADWAGYQLFVNIFMTYLLTKYKSTCFKTTQDYPKLNIYESDHITQETMRKFSERIVRCLLNDNIQTNIIVIPLFVSGIDQNNPNVGHQNLLIYRKDISVIEHFEPHGRLNNYTSEYFIKGKIKILAYELSRVMTKFNIKHIPIKVINPADICPNKVGFQKIEGLSNLPIKTGGFCAIWTFFFAEMVLSNPTVSSKDLFIQISNMFFDYNDVLKKYKTTGYFSPEYFWEKKKSNPFDFFRNLINGYTLLFNEKIVKYFSVFYGRNVNINAIIKSMKGDQKLANKIHDDIENISIYESNVIYNKNFPKPKFMFENVTPVTATNQTYKPVNPVKLGRMNKIKNWVKKKCKYGTRKNKNVANCANEETLNTQTLKKPRCPNGTRRNKKSGNCESSSD